MGLKRCVMHKTAWRAWHMRVILSRPMRSSFKDEIQLFGGVLVARIMKPLALNKEPEPKVGMGKHAAWANDFSHSKGFLGDRRKLAKPSTPPMQIRGAGQKPHGKIIMWHR